MPKPKNKLRFIKPMLATLVDRPFDEPNWYFEVKWDGYRVISILSDGEVSLFSRMEQNYTQNYAPAANELKKIKHQAILDGEMVVVDKSGRSSFQALQQYHKTGEGNLRYYIFDILHLDGNDLKSKTLFERKQILEKLLKGRRTHVHYAGHVQGRGMQFFKAARKNGLEGIIAKNIESTYKPGVRNKDWLKIKIHREQEAVIAGYTEPRGGRSFFGALVLGVYEKGKLIYIGHIGGGFDYESLKSVAEKLKPLKQKECPFLEVPKTNMPVTWLKPKLVCQIKFQEWTSDGIMRQPIFLGLRDDKKPNDVKRELPEHV